jgi:hypothetical protein
MKWGGIYRKQFELWFLFLLWNFLNFFEFQLVKRVKWVGSDMLDFRDYRVLFLSFPGRVGTGLAQFFFSNFFARVCARTASSNGSWVWRVWARIGSERVAATGRIWPGRVILTIYITHKATNFLSFHFIMFGRWFDRGNSWGWEWITNL